MQRVAWLLLVLGSASGAAADDIQASAPSALSVTVYRAPRRIDGRFDLNSLAGFALITETRTVQLPAGESRVRFEGVADGIEPASALVSGLASGVVEKNRDAQLLSPSALAAQAVGKQVELLRGDPKTGNIERRVGTILADADGVIFKTDQGIEALRCSGLAESFAFEPLGGLSARPTLSVLVRSPSATTQQVTLSYLSRGFDWSADYTARLSADGKTLDLGAWLTLANANGTGFPSAHTQVVAGRVNRAGDGELSPIEIGAPISAQCWPRGSTSDTLVPPAELMSFKVGSGAPLAAMATRSLKNSSDALAEVRSTARQEQLGDLKLYRIPERTTVASRQSKQVRLLDRSGVPVAAVYGVDLQDREPAGEPFGQPFGQPVAATRLLRTKNTAANHLGLPLPSGSIAVYRGRDEGARLESESSLRDLAVGQEIEIKMGRSAEVQVTKVVESNRDDSSPANTRVQISNAGDGAIQFELRLRFEQHVLRADHPLSSKDGRPIFYLSVPAHGTATVHFVCSATRT